MLCRPPGKPLPLENRYAGAYRPPSRGRALPRVPTPWRLCRGAASLPERPQGRKGIEIARFRARKGNRSRARSAFESGAAEPAGRKSPPLLLRSPTLPPSLPRSFFALSLSLSSLPPSLPPFLSQHVAKSISGCSAGSMIVVPTLSVNSFSKICEFSAHTGW